MSTEPLVDNVGTVHKVGYVEVTYEFLANLLQLPPGAKIVETSHSQFQGMMRLVIQGVGKPTRVGELLTNIPVKLTSHLNEDGKIVGTRIHWNE